jgi:hypothetical protein
MSLEGATSYSSLQAAPKAERCGVSGIIELADGRELCVDVMHVYGSSGVKKAGMHDVHQMRVYSHAYEKEYGNYSKKAKRPLPGLVTQLGGLAVCSIVVVLVSWQIGVWFAVMTR